MDNGWYSYTILLHGNYILERRFLYDDGRMSPWRYLQESTSVEALERIHKLYYSMYDYAAVKAEAEFSGKLVDKVQYRISKIFS